MSRKERRNTWTVLSVCAISTILLFPIGVFGATPPSGNVSTVGDSFSWTGGPFTSVNATPSTCVEGVSCDIFQLQLTIPANQVAAVRFRIDWVNNLNDFDLFVFDTAGNEIDNSGAGGTEFEEVTIGDLPAGTYLVVTNAFSTVNATYDGLVELVNLQTVTNPPPLDLDNTIGFRNTIVDFSGVSGEPFIRTDNLGDTYVSVPFGFSTTHSLLWKSIDGTRSYIALGSPVTRDAVAGLGGGDTHQDFDANNFLYYVDLSAVCVTAAVSTDGGNTFDPLRNNQVTCVSASNPSAAGDDRQWVSAFGNGIAYATWRNLTFADFWMFKTDDGGLSWDGGTLLGPVTQSGPIQTDKSLRAVGTKDAILTYQVFYRGNDVRVFRITDFNDGSPIQVDDLLVADRDQSVGNVFPILSVDTAGNLYAVWSEGATQIFMATSTNRGNTWSEPVKVGTAFGTNIMPWIKAGDPGRVAIVWYNSPLKGNPNVPESVWNIYMAQTLNALDPLPRFTNHQVNHTVIHFMEICLRGLGCNLSVPMGDRSFLEFPSIDIDSDGAAVITYNDNTNQAAAPYVMVAKQLNGASLYAAVGDLENTDPGTVTLDEPMDGQVVETATMAAAGTHTLPAENFDRDEPGDARFPDHGAVIGESIDALDIRCVTIDSDADDVIVTMEIADLTLPALLAAPAQSGGDGVLYLTQWDFNHDVFWVAAEVRAGVPVFHTGSLGVVTSGTSKKYITYNPNAADSLQVVGTIDNSAPGRITMRIPRSLVGNPADSDTVFHATGYAMSQRGPLLPVQSGEPGEEGVPNLSSFPIKVDASGGFTHTLGDGPSQAGVVELSIDDSGFGAPFNADDLGDCAPRWQATVDVSGLAEGEHTLCARQIIDGREPSQEDCITFIIPSPPPVANDDQAETRKNRPKRINVVANDETSNPPLTVTEVTDPPNGTVSNNGDGTVTYTPDLGFVGTDTFEYTVCDNSNRCDSATVTVIVKQPSDDDSDDDDFDDDGSRDDSDSDDDNDGISDDADSDDDNDGISDDSDSDDDNDGIADEFDSESSREQQSSQQENLAAGGSSEHTVIADSGTLLIWGMAEAAEAQFLTVEIYDPAGSLVSVSVPTPGRALASTVPLMAGNYTIRVTNSGTQAVDAKTTLIKSTVW